MSLPRPYPPDTYCGDDGEVSAWLRGSDQPQDVTYRNGVTCEYLATGDRTAERFGLYRWTFGDDESGPDPHFHRSISEQFYVLSGEVRLYDGRQWVTARSGDFLYVPEGGIHGFRGADRASMLWPLLHRRRTMAWCDRPPTPGAPWHAARRGGGAPCTSLGTRPDDPSMPGYAGRVSCSSGPRVVRRSTSPACPTAPRRSGTPSARPC
jgi:mannose-6-phosphate isomerase-like protein (cupin superfamily)